MGIKDKFNSLKLEYQLQISIIISSALICGTLIVITYFQLDWLRGMIIAETEKTLTDKIYSSMENIGLAESRRMENYIQIYMNYIENLKTIEEEALGLNEMGEYFNNNQAPVQDNTLEDDEISYDKGTFMTRLSGLSDKGKDLELKQAVMDLIFPKMYRENMVFIYAGFEINEISHRYPGIKIVDRTYSPITREWYYKADDNKGIPVLTEPHIDEFTSDWVFSVSLSLVDNNNKIFGAVGVDLRIKPYIDIVDKYTILDTGFIIIVSEAGNMLNIPKQWDFDNSMHIKIYNETVGITKNIWESIKIIPNKAEFEFEHVYDITVNEGNDNKTTYKVMKYDVKPYKDQDNITHFVLVCMNKTELLDKVNYVRGKFYETYVVIFFVVLAFALVVFIIIALLLRTNGRKIGKQFSKIEKVFLSIVSRGLLPDLTSNVSFVKLKNYDKGIESLVSACEEKVKIINLREDNFTYFDWKGCRPSDTLLYASWADSLYPFNIFGERDASWKFLLTKLSSFDQPV
ncbi:hypothetical protein SteCoe_17702 [Stentor coeruleus]|uniref:Cache domain-containing protein n=1 Tax=Stentor coeruleus TaxID=5963 RepID=A0A1R2BYH6_9CILI|nr:hypothetical protein SteCoe_17702 [Stentor coeruleus]